MRSGIDQINHILKKDSHVLSVFTTAGYPKFDDTAQVCLALDKAGVGFIELGIPFSDPIADGETIQRSSDLAIKNGMTLSKIFPQVKEIREKSSIPILLMGYYNPILQYGIDNFLDSCASSGIDGLIVPDLPRDEFLKVWQSKIEERNISFVFLVTPQTSESRIREIDELSSSFIYAVSSSGVTGGTVNQNKQEEYYLRLKNLNLKHPILIGFGIRDKETFSLTTKYVKGAIIGSEFLRKIENSNNLDKDIKKFISSILMEM